jgi:hypothetical protein
MFQVTKVCDDGSSKSWSYFLLNLSITQLSFHLISYGRYNFIAVSSLQVFQPKFNMHLSPPPCVLHAHPISFLTGWSYFVKATYHGSPRRAHNRVFSLHGVYSFTKVRTNQYFQHRPEADVSYSITNLSDLKMFQVVEQFSKARFQSNDNKASCFRPF